MPFAKGSKKDQIDKWVKSGNEWVLMSAEDIAKRFGVRPRTVRKVLSQRRHERAKADLIESLARFVEFPLFEGDPFSIAAQRWDWLETQFGKVFMHSTKAAFPSVTEGLGI